MFDLSQYSKSFAQRPSIALLEQLKRDAKRFKLLAGVTHAQALDELSRRAGFSNFTDAQRRCTAEPSVPRQVYSLEKAREYLAQWVDLVKMIPEGADTPDSVSLRVSKAQLLDVLERLPVTEPFELDGFTQDLQFALYQTILHEGVKGYKVHFPLDV
ncbi:hypothetical protein HNP46_006742 [Pseudomonas nitritireducens]|uniref:Uncharacterized protein n=1 Tax=Pseudomonas nitroreducens TaxID=46680 RepID=A0A7W7KSR7_PSENT|nr:hypothetical protein [Pseudomonas nitritireducens]MBB4867823.1 hypothetical protein [Pseudomonas nitritireducens]